MTEGSFVPLAGSERNALPRVQDLGPVSDSERIEVTLMLRRGGAGAARPGGGAGCGGAGGRPRRPS